MTHRTAGIIGTVALEAPLRLTGLSHGAGCACKIGPGQLQEVLARMPLQRDSPTSHWCIGTIVGAGSPQPAHNRQSVIQVERMRGE